MHTAWTLFQQKAVIFGGLASESNDPKLNIPKCVEFSNVLCCAIYHYSVREVRLLQGWSFHMCRYLNDVFMLEIRVGTSLLWQCPVIEGPSPSPQ